jgi:transposase
MARLRVPRPIGRPRTAPDTVLADKAYSSRAIRDHLRRRGIRAVIPQPSDQIAHRKRRGRNGGRPPAFDRQAYKQRNTVERCINKLKQWRGLATRYDKTATIYSPDSTSQASSSVSTMIRKKRPRRDHPSPRPDLADRAAYSDRRDDRCEVVPAAESHPRNGRR